MYILSFVNNKFDILFCFFELLHIINTLYSQQWWKVEIFVKTAMSIVHPDGVDSDWVSRTIWKQFDFCLRSSKVERLKALVRLLKAHLIEASKLVSLVEFRFCFLHLTLEFVWQESGL